LAEEFLYLFKVGALPVWGRRAHQPSPKDAIADALEILDYLVRANKVDIATACVGRGPTRSEAEWFGEWRWAPQTGAVWSDQANPEPLPQPV